MNLKINNVGQIKDANIDINGITVIAGINGSGKTTIAKLLYAHWKSHGLIAKDTTDQLVTTAIYNRLVQLNNNFSRNNLDATIDLDYNKEKNFIKIDATTYNNIKSIVATTNNSAEEKIEQILALSNNRNISKFNNDDKNLIEKAKQDILSYLKIIETNKSSDSPFIKKHYLQQEFQTDKILDYTIVNNTVINDVVLMGEYDPYPSYDGNMQPIVDHIQDFSHRIRMHKIDNPVEEFVHKDKLDDLKNIISNMIDGKFTYDKEKQIFVFTNSKNQNFTPINTAKGLKTLGYFSQLLTLDFVTNNNILILDEPETSLHPTWQVNFANALIELHKEFDLKIVILSHSPYFIDAMRNFTKLSNVKTNWYLLQETKDGYISIDTKEDIGLIAEALDEGFSQIDRKTLEQKNFEDIE